MTVSHPASVSGVQCILCHRATTEVVDRISVERIRNLWLERLAIRLPDEVWDGAREVEVYRCADCGLEFFPPRFAGTDRLYEQLQSFGWYYMKDKWEHDVALDDIPAETRVLEVGCATGTFVERLSSVPGVSARGIELNSSAVAEAVLLNRKVTRESLGDVVSRERGTYDVVCSFQVLEHVSDPHQFIAESVSLLQRGGRLILCVPHADSFIRREFNPLDMPPHHMSRWTHRALQSLEPLFGLSLIRVVEEPLAAYHVMGYLASRLRPLRTLPGGILLANRFVYRAIATGVHVTGIRRFLQGQSIYACFQRI